MKSPNRYTPGRYDVLRDAHAQALRAETEQNQSSPDAGSQESQGPFSEYERWRRQTLARIESDRAREAGPPATTGDKEFERQLDAKQKLADELFKLEFGEDEERRPAWRNHERRILMQMLPENEEAKELGDLRRRERWLHVDKGLRSGPDSGAEP